MHFNIKNIRSFLVVLGFVTFALILLSHVFRCRAAYCLDIDSPLSDSRHAGKWHKKYIHPGDIILAEPDYVMESVMYYHYHPFFLPREKRFNTYVHFTTANASMLSLKDLIGMADSFNLSGKRTMVMIRERMQFRDTVIRYSYGKEFIIDTVALSDFNRRYRLLDSFRNSYATDEQYYFYTRR